MFVLIVGRDLERSADLSATLTALGLDWTVQWVGEAAEAQALLEGRGVDVVAVDGGEARGIDVLRRAREKNPTAVRLLLLPPGAEPSAAAIDIAHRHLGLPLQANALVEAVEGDRVVLRHTAIVGKIDRQTPIVNSKINEIIVNPYWNAPESIVRKDIIPLMRKNPQYLAENNIRILGPDGNEIDPATIDWNTEDAAKFRFRQDPGSINAMASVKINFPSPDGVYMHDTPSQSLFNKLMRFDSSGCVRVQNVRDLVTWILKNTPGWDRQHFEATIKSGANTPVAVADPVPVYFTYISAWSTGDGVVQFRDDIYARDGVDELQISSTTL